MLWPNDCSFLGIHFLAAINVFEPRPQKFSSFAFSLSFSKLVFQFIHLAGLTGSAKSVNLLSLILYHNYKPFRRIVCLLKNKAAGDY